MGSEGAPGNIIAAFLPLVVMILLGVIIFKLRKKKIERSQTKQKQSVMRNDAPRIDI